jgi:hypothetical protein
MNNSRFNDAQKPFHTHTYAQAAGGDAMGSTNNQSFQQRYRIDQNRKHIQKYRDSHVANGSHLRDELRKRLDGDDPQRARSDAPVPSRQSFVSRSKPVDSSATAGQPKPVAPPPKQSFREPPKRGFNPFQ